MKVIDLWGDQPPGKAHRKVLQDAHRFIVLVAGRKFRKTSIGLVKLWKGAITTPLVYPYIAPFRKQAKKIVWDDHVPRMLGLLKKSGIPYKKNDSELTIKFPGGGQFQLDGSDNAEALRGIGNWGGVVLGEYSDWKSDVWGPIVRPNLMPTKAWAIFEGTPKGYNHFHKLAKYGDHKNLIEGDIYDESGQIIPSEQYLDKYFNTWRFTSYDNPYLDREEIEIAKKQSTKEWFEQEYLAKFTKYTGLVYKEFERGVHVIEPFDIPMSWRIYRGFDFGTTNPTVCLWIAVDNDNNWFIISEHYQTQQTIDYHAGQVNANTFSKRVRVSYGDPSGSQWIKEFGQRKIHITPANKEVKTSFTSWVRLGIEKVGEKLKRTPGHNIVELWPQIKEEEQVEREKGLPSLFVFNNCLNTIREFEAYRWKEKSISQAQDVNEPDIPEKANDHAMDALRYFAVSFKKPLPTLTQADVGGVKPFFEGLPG